MRLIVAVNVVSNFQSSRLEFARHVQIRLPSWCLECRLRGPPVITEAAVSLCLLVMVLVEGSLLLRLYCVQVIRVLAASDLVTESICK